MFLDRDTTGGDGIIPQIQQHQSFPPNTTIIQEGKVTSHTGHSERRKQIRIQGVEILVANHNALIDGILSRGTISVSERNQLLAMQQEGIQAGGEFYGKIYESREIVSVPHQEGMSRYNTLLGNTEILTGNSQLRIWTMLSK